MGRLRPTSQIQTPLQPRMCRDEGEWDCNKYKWVSLGFHFKHKWSTLSSPFWAGRQHRMDLLLFVSSYNSIFSAFNFCLDFIHNLILWFIIWFYGLISETTFYCKFLCLDSLLFTCFTFNTTLAGLFIVLAYLVYLLWHIFLYWFQQIEYETELLFFWNHGKWSYMQEKWVTFH